MRSPNRERPIRIRGLYLIAAVGTVSALSAIVLGLTPPSGYSSTPWGIYAAIILGGVVVLAIPPQIIYRFRRAEWSTDADLGTKADS